MRDAINVLLRAIVATTLVAFHGTSAQGLPARLSDTEFWRLVTDFSEPTGTFPSENFASNENGYQWVIPTLLRRTLPASAYIGVGPEQNFTYIAALQPKIAFIVDIRRQAMLQHLVYKALFEMAEDRGDFLSLMFSRPRPAGLGPNTTPEALFAAYDSIAPDRVRFQRTVGQIKDRLVRLHGFTLSKDDLGSIEYIFWVFEVAGPHLNYSSPGGGPGQSGRTIITMPTTRMITSWFTKADGTVDTVTSRVTTLPNGKPDTALVKVSFSNGVGCYRFVGGADSTLHCDPALPPGFTFSVSTSGVSPSRGAVPASGTTPNRATMFFSPMRVDLSSLMAQVDSTGMQRSFLATEQNYRSVRDLEVRNLVVPIVGDFAGPKALHAIGQYLKEHGAVVSPSDAVVAPLGCAGPI